MIIETLKDKVIKSEIKVDKCKGTIERHKKQLEKKLKLGDDFDIRMKENDIVNSNKKLLEAERILKNWNDKLEVELEKERFLEGNAPDVIKYFLEDWKKKALDWHLSRYEDYQEYKIFLKEEEYKTRVECVKIYPEYSKYLNDEGEIQDYYKNNLLNVYPSSLIDSYLIERELDWKSLKAKKVSFAGFNVLYMDNLYSESERYNWILNKLEKEKKSKMIDLVSRINNEVGKITDASDLSISAVGNLNGLIIGETGVIKIETVGAGGYNIQCFHYRTLISKI